MPNPLIERAIFALKDALGDNTTPASSPPTRYRPSFGRGPKLQQLEKPTDPIQGLASLFSTPYKHKLQQKESFRPVNSGPVYDTIQEMNKLHPDAMNRVGTVTMRPIDDAIANVNGSHNINIDTDWLQSNNIGNYTDMRTIDILRHEAAHTLGYHDEDRKGTIPTIPTSAQDVDEASRATRGSYRGTEPFINRPLFLPRHFKP